ncbi:MAG TPA: rod shape-determining protein [Candidatus Woesebacteria bacterium]|nr:rod shape-determining protein [Candidatus Woesebacteria bacterium]HRT40274.1 rod shape-determining protein [Candidatus Woesebacteria bacterium]
MKLLRRLGIDLGTSNTLIWAENEGVVLSEPTLVAVSIEERKILAVGNEAKEMVGKTPEYIEVVKPLEDGAIADYEVSEAMIKAFLRRVIGKNWFVGPEVMIGVPAGITQVEQRAVLDAALGAGARKVYLIDKPLAAAIGTKIPVAESLGNMIVDLGGGNTEAAVVALGGIVTHNSGKVGGIKIDRAIVDHFRKVYGIIIGEQTAEMVKIKLGSAVKLKRVETTEVTGRDFLSGLPKSIQVDSEAVYEVLKPILGMILEVIQGALAITPPELLSDIIDRGIVLAGGSSQIRNLNVLLTREIGVSVHVALEPQLCVIKGIGLALENLDTYKKALCQQ